MNKPEPIVLIKTFDEYQNVANSTSSLDRSHPEYGPQDLRYRDTRVIPGPPLPPANGGRALQFGRLDHACAGIASEAGEIAEHLKHVRFHGKALDLDYLVKEFGDLLWYIAEGAAAIGYSMAFIAWRNRSKLRARYPEGHFSVSRSENRDGSKE